MQKKVDSGALLVKTLLQKDKLTVQLKDLNDAIKHYKIAPIQSQIDIEMVAKSCYIHGYKEIGERVNDLAKTLDDYAKARF